MKWSDIGLRMFRLIWDRTPSAASGHIPEDVGNPAVGRIVNDLSDVIALMTPWGAASIAEGVRPWVYHFVRSDDYLLRIICKAEEMIDEYCRMCEKADAEAWSSMLGAADDTFKDRYHVQGKRIGGMVVGATGSFDVIALNRAVGVGVEHTTSVDELQQIVTLFEESGSSRFAVQLCPSAATDETLALLKQEQFTHFNNWTKLIRRVDHPAPDIDTALTVEQIDHADAQTFAEIVCPAFGWPGLMKQWIMRMVGREGWRHYIAYENTIPVGTGALYIHDDIGWLGFAATKPDYRRLGAQSSLICRRLMDARDAGCSHLVVETAEEKPERPNPSHHNLLRFGFKVAYQRPNYLRAKKVQA
jgi:hypothetical protein